MYNLVKIVSLHGGNSMFTISEEKKIIWFEKDEKNRAILVKPDGTRKVFKDESYMPFKTVEANLGWQRAKLYMTEHDIWDATAFGCSMDIIIGYPIKDNEGYYVLLLATPQAAERHAYPFLDKNVVHHCRNNVREFYRNQNLQAMASAYDLILHAVGLKYNIEERTFEPLNMDFVIEVLLQNSTSKGFPVNTLDKTELEEALKIRNIRNGDALSKEENMRQIRLIDRWADDDGAFEIVEPAPDDIDENEEK